MYGPDVGIGVFPASLAGASAGRMDACGTDSLYDSSGSGSTRLMTILLVALSTTTPLLRSQLVGVFRHAAAPMMPL